MLSIFARVSISVLCPCCTADTSNMVHYTLAYLLHSAAQTLVSIILHTCSKADGIIGLQWEAARTISPAFIPIEMRHNRDSDSAMHR